MTGAKLKMAVLYDVWGDDTAPAEVVREGKGARKQNAKRKPRTKKKIGKKSSRLWKSSGMSRFIKCWMVAGSA